MTTRGWRDWLGEAVHLFREAAQGVEEEAVDPLALQGLSPQDVAGEVPEDLIDVFTARNLLHGGSPLQAWLDPLTQLDDALSRFLRGRRVAAAITAPSGAGSGVLLEEFARATRRRQPELRRDRWDVTPELSLDEGALLRALSEALEVPDVDDLDTLRQRLLDGPPRLLTVHGGHHLYMRTIGGFQVLRRALSLLGGTLGRVLWVVEVDAVAWSYLNQVFRLGSYFDLVLELPALEADDLRACFERGLASLSGRYAFQFLPPRELDRELAAGDWRQEHYWERLAAASRGNPRAAASLFRQGLRWSEQRQQAFVLPPPDLPSQQILASLTPTALLGLALILEHQTLSCQQLADLLLLNAGEAQAVLDALERKSVVFSQGEGPEYVVNPPWQAAVCEHLTGWNLL